ncbi:retrotransposon protein, putative, ty1-copia subclass, partial [Tanacetum coccineum]
DYALESATRILNMVPTKKVDKTPYELWYGKVPNLSYLKVWGCEALVKLDKLQQRSVKFSGRAIDLEEIQDEDTSPSEITIEIPIEVKGFEPPQEEEILIRRSERSRRVPYRLCLNVEVEKHSLGDLNEPTSYKVVMLDSESDMDGIVHTYKARLVAKGYTQLYGVDYEETFSPVANIRAIRILVSISAFYDYEIWKMDVKTVFLNGYLDEDIYMVQPKGFVDPNHLKTVCKLQRSIYGLMQASRS